MLLKTVHKGLMMVCRIRRGTIGKYVLIAVILCGGCAMNYYAVFQDLDTVPQDNTQKYTIDNCSEEIGKIYMLDVRKKIYSEWHYPGQLFGGMPTGKVVTQFFIERDGTVSTINILKSSGKKLLDDASEKAIKKASPFLTIPSCVDNTIEVKCTFKYEVRERK